VTNFSNAVGFFFVNFSAVGEISDLCDAVALFSNNSSDGVGLISTNLCDGVAELTFAVQRYNNFWIKARKWRKNRHFQFRDALKALHRKPTTPTHATPST
jgi:hypothetical protein